MASYEEAYEKFTGEMNKLGLFHHDETYHAVMKHLGPSVHDKDASLVACSDPNELKTVKENFLIGTLGLEDGPELDKAIEQVCGALGESNKHKHRATFYYLLAVILKKEDVLIEKTK